MGRWDDWLVEQRTHREALGLTRAIQTRSALDEVLDLAGNDYLGLSRADSVRAAAAAAVDQWGAGAGASRLVTGTLAVHTELERDLASFLGQPAAVVMSTGYHANLAAVCALADAGAVVISDAHVHASLVDAARLSRAEVVVVPHSDLSVIEAALAQAGPRRALVLTESVYSVLGDAAPLGEIGHLCRSYDAMLLVDEAHGLGVAGPDGRGLVAAAGLNGDPRVVVTATLSKSLGAQGGAVLGSGAVQEQMINRARPFIYDTGLAPAAAAGAHAALQVVRRSPELPQLVRARVNSLARALAVPVPAGAVLSVPMASPLAALSAQAECLAAGIAVGCFRPPSVPDGVSRLRITCSAGLSDAQWDRAVTRLSTVIRRLA